MANETRRNTLLGFKPGTLIGDKYKILSRQPVANRRVVAADPYSIGTAADLAEPLGSGSTSTVFLAEQMLDRDVTVPRVIKLFIYRDDIADLHPHFQASRQSDTRTKA